MKKLFYSLTAFFTVGISMVIFFALTTILSGCDDVSRLNLRRYAAINARHKVTLYDCAGNVIKTWESTHAPDSDSVNSAGWYFTDVVTGKMVKVSGTLVIEQK